MLYVGELREEAQEAYIFFSDGQNRLWPKGDQSPSFLIQNRTLFA